MVQVQLGPPSRLKRGRSENEGEAKQKKAKILAGEAAKKGRFFDNCIQGKEKDTRSKPSRGTA